jgi:hypothetical protein
MVFSHQGFTMRLVFFLAGLAFLSSVAVAQSAAPDLDEKLLQAAFQGELKDSDSAKFRALRYKLDAPSIWTMCGEVTAKNSYGGYAGFQPFYAQVLFLAPGPVEYSVIGMGQSAGEMCREALLRP